MYNPVKIVFLVFLVFNSAGMRMPIGSISVICSLNYFMNLAKSVLRMSPS